MTASSLNWRQFKAQLLANPELLLQFQYAENRRVAPSYHITEIKQAPITSVDCGGQKNEWTEIIVQLWEPEGKQQEAPMPAAKALSIIAIVEKVLPLEPEAVLKVEFGNSEFATRQMLPRAIHISASELTVDLQPDVTQCKAINRGGSCGTGDKGDECCAPAETAKVQFKNLLVTGEACAPGSGCC